MLFLLAGCAPAPVEPMRIGMNVWPGYEPLLLARHHGFLTEQNFRLVELSDASEVVRAFRNNTLEAACLTLDEVLYTMQDGMDPVILLVMDQSQGADVLLAREGIGTLANLKGKRIGVEVSAVGAYMLTRSLQEAGLTRADITPVYLPIEKHLQAFSSGRVDAVVTFEPVRTKLLALGAIDLFNSSKMPGEIVDVLVVRRDYLEAHPERAVELRNAWFKALAEIGRSLDESAKLMAVREQVTVEQFKTSLRGLHFPDAIETGLLVRGANPKLRAPAEQLKAVMRDAGLLQRDVPLDSLFKLPDRLREPP